MQKRILALYRPAKEELVGSKGSEAVPQTESRTVRRRRHRDAAVFSIDDITAVASLVCRLSSLQRSC